MTMPIGRIVEYWIHHSDGGLDCREGKEWSAVRRWIAEAIWTHPDWDDYEMEWKE
jgi:hypothetical protein